MKTSHITQQDIANHLGVTRITVSKALRDHPDISKGMKARVRKAVEDLGYSPNLIARQLTLQKTFTLGVVIPDLENSFFAYLTDSIIDAAREREYHIILTVSREKEEDEANNIRNLLGMRVDGLLVCLSQQTVKPEVFEAVRKMNVPLVFFDRAFRDLEYNMVVFNDRSGTLEAMHRLISAGYRKIAHFAGYATTSVGKERCSAYLEALRIHHIPVNPDWILEGGYEIEDGFRACNTMLARKDLPEIVLAVNDRVALGAYKAIRRAGLRIPEDIGMVGYGFNETAQLFSPTLSIINQDPRKMGNLAANLLLDEIEGKSFPQGMQVLIEEDFQWNTSVGKRT